MVRVQCARNKGDGMVDRRPEPAGHDSVKARLSRSRTRILTAAGLLVVGLLAVLCMWTPSRLYPPLSRADLQGIPDVAKVQELKGARLRLQNDSRTAMLQGLGALLVLTGAVIGARVTLPANTNDP